MLSSACFFSLSLEGTDVRRLSPHRMGRGPRAWSQPDAVALQHPIRCSEARGYPVRVPGISAHVPISDLGQFSLKMPEDVGTWAGGRGWEPGGAGRGLSILVLVFLLVFDSALGWLGASVPSPPGGTFMFKDSFSQGECRGEGMTICLKQQRGLLLEFGSWHP